MFFSTEPRKGLSGRLVAANHKCQGMAQSREKRKGRILDTSLYDTFWGNF